MLKKIIEKAKAFGFDDFEIIETASQEVRLSLFKGNLDKNFTGCDKLYTLKGIINKKLASMNLEKNDKDLSDEEIDNLLAKLKENVLSITTNEEASVFGGSEKYAVLSERKVNINSKTTAEKIEMIKELEKKTYEASEKVELVHSCQYFEGKDSLKIVNSKGLNLSKENEYCGIMLGCIVGESKDNPNKQNGYARKITIDINEFNLEKMYKEATEYGLSMLGAKPVDSKSYKVIIEKDCMTSLLSGFSSIFSGESLLRKVTPLTTKLNEKIMSEKVTIIDDPLCDEAIIRSTFDSEGVATYTKNVVENGVFKTFLHNLKTAKALNTVSTGNATKRGVSGMNLYIKNGDTSLDDMISSLDEGLLITNLAGLHAGLNAISGDFSGQASGYYIKDGKKVHPVTLVVLSGNFLTMMNDIVTIGNDLEIQYNGYGAPSILFNSLPVSGK